MKYFLFLLILVILLHTTYAQPGTLDPSFANKGKLIDTLNSYAESTPVAVQKDGKIIIGSYAYVQNIPVFRVARYLSNGTLDTSFGEKGNAYGPISYGLRVSALALQPDGKIVVAGGFDASVFRFDKDGTLDSGFGTNGIARISSIYEHYINAILIQPDGKIVLGGNEVLTDEFGQTESLTFAILRMMENGKLDENFGDGGKVVSENGKEIKSLLLQPDGKIIAGGYNLDQHFYMERYLSNGAIDKGFGEDGSVETTFEAINNSCRLNGLALQTDGKILAAGTTTLKRYPDLLLARYYSDGQLDKTFNDSGKVITHFPVNGAEGVSVLVMPNNKIVVAGNNIDQNAGNSDFALTCYNDDGSLDQTFGDNGFTFTDVRGSDVVSSAALQPDGKIVVAGNSYTATKPYYGISVVRYDGFDNSKQPLTVRIKRWLQHHGISWQAADNNTVRYYAVQRSENGISYKEVARVSRRTGINSYEDISSLSNSNYYRIVAFSTDGSRTYSNNVFINEAQQARIFPNPVKDNLQVQGLPASGKTNVSVMDLNGNVRSSAMATGINYSVSTANLSSGSYLLKIQHNGTTTTQPFVKD